MDTTTIVALILVVAGPIALYFLRRGNMRSNGIIDGVNWEKFCEKQKTLHRECIYNPAYSNLSSNIWHDD